MEPTVTQSGEHEPLNILEYEMAARAKLSREAYDYYAGYSWDGITVRENREAYNRIALRPKMLVDVSQRRQAIELFGRPLSMPILVAPMAFQAMADEEGEIATAKACQSIGTTMVLSTLANFSIEEVTAATDQDIWFQLYVYKDKAITKSLVERAEAAGCKALVLTVDSPLLGRRENDVRNRFHLPKHLAIANLAGSFRETLPAGVDDSGLAVYIESLYDTALTWKDLEWLCTLTKMPVLVKGVLRGDDAKQAIKCGASGIIVSNHGGRQLDTAISTIAALPEIVQAVGSETTVLVDGGIRRGTDVMKALALGAKAVLVGRPVIWGLAANGWQGALEVLKTLGSELDLAMALSGCPEINSITRDLVVLP
jgi:4-hydroxymandelate oxidase